jgi:two-component sensor histidine kinase
VTWQLYETDGTPLPHDRCPMAVAVREQREVRGAEAVAARPDGTRVPFIPFPTPLRDENGTMVGAVNMLVDITERKRAEEAQQVLIHELNHRVKNTLASVQSIAAQTFRVSPEPSEFLEKFQGRLLALSKAHDLLTGRNWTGLRAVELFDAVLDPYAVTQRHGSIRRDGPEVLLPPRTALALGMVLHELATNAAKYGALSGDTGRVDLQWSMDQAPTDTRFHLCWRESGGPNVTTPTTLGFGTRFMERSIVKDLGGGFDLAFEPGGVCCRMHFIPT